MLAYVNMSLTVTTSKGCCLPPAYLQLPLRLLVLPAGKDVNKNIRICFGVGKPVGRCHYLLLLYRHASSSSLAGFQDVLNFILLI